MRKLWRYITAERDCCIRYLADFPEDNHFSVFSHNDTRYLCYNMMRQLEDIIDGLVLDKSSPYDGNLVFLDNSRREELLQVTRLLELVRHSVKRLVLVPILEEKARCRQMCQYRECGRITEEKQLLCGGDCRAVNYCCRECAVNDWDRHSKECEKTEVSYITKKEKEKVRKIDKEREEEVKKVVREFYEYTI